MCKAALALLMALLRTINQSSSPFGASLLSAALTPLWLLSSLAPKAWALPN
ncbi:hypothetical protein COCC4DRAFT_34101, partial [Bipolaris maydis ATCC 48331]